MERSLPRTVVVECLEELGLRGARAARRGVRQLVQVAAQGLGQRGEALLDLARAQLGVQPAARAQARGPQRPGPRAETAEARTQRLQRLARLPVRAVDVGV